MEKHPIENLMTTTMDSLRDMVDVNTVIGEAIATPDGATVIPISRVSFGFVAGGGEYGEKDPDNHASDEYECIADPSDSSRHIRSRACCGADASVEEHKGESVSCLEPVKCTECGFEYEEHGDHVYSDSCDNVCNVCGQPTRGKRFHLDENKDGKCDHCGAEVGENDIGFADDVHTDSESDGDDDDDGCGASVGFGAVAILITTIGAGALFVKKKEN